MNIIKNAKVKAEGKLLTIILAMVLGLLVITPAVRAFAAMGDYWEIKIRGEHFAYVSGESDVIMLTNKILDHYVTGPYGLKDASISSDFTAEKGTFNKDEEEIEITGNPTTLLPELLEKVEVTAVYEEMATKEVPFKTVYEEDPEMYEDEEYIRVEGQRGTRTTIDEVTRVNGEEVSRTELSVVEEIPAVNQVVVKGTKEAPYFIYPVEGTITFGFGYRSSWSTYGVGSTNHKGIDITVPTGTPVKAARDGVVFDNTGWVAGYGNVVFLDHGDGMVSIYAHNSSLNVSLGDVVKRGDIIAYAGSTGASTAPHVHFEVHKDGVAVDPMNYL